MKKCEPYVKEYDDENNLVNPIGINGYRHPTKELRDNNGNFLKLVPIDRKQKVKKFKQHITGKLSWGEEMKLKLHFIWLEKVKPQLFNNIKI